VIQRLLFALALSALCCLACAAPAGWPQPHYRFEQNPVTPAGFELGRHLFYDPLLSVDGSTSCASCHQQASAFAHTRHRLSHGVGGRLGTRNAPPLFNLAWQPDFMRDGAATHLETQPLLPLVNPLEMAASPAKIVEQLRAQPEYRRLFKAAFGSEEIDTQRMLRALAQFTGSLVSADSRYDRVRAGQASYTATEARGLTVFREHCAACHAEPLFTDFSYRRNGLAMDPNDTGRMMITQREDDRGRFRVPSLRNVAVTQPYMHDGRFETLEQVLDHYDHGVDKSADPERLPAGGLHLPLADRRALLAFLDSLTDATLLHDPRFAEPPPAPAPLSARLRKWIGRFVDHGDKPTRAPTQGSSRIAWRTDALEIVALRRTDELLLYVDDERSNAPVDGLSIQLRANGLLLSAARRAEGLYAFPTERLAVDRSHPVELLLRGPRVDLRLRSELPALEVPGRRTS
jgi:cytochrome c peroxidase